MHMLATLGVVLAITLGAVGPVTAQEVSDAVLQRYIDIGAEDNFGDIRASCTAKAGGWTQALQQLGTGSVEQYSVGGTTWLARVSISAKETVEKLMPRPTAEAMRALSETQAFVISVSPMALTMSGASMLNDIQHVVLRHRGDDSGETVIQPTAVEAAETRTFTNLFGAGIAVTGVIAAFDQNAVLKLAREKDLTVVLVMRGGGQRRCNLDDTKILRQFGVGR